MQNSANYRRIQPDPAWVAPPSTGPLHQDVEADNPDLDFKATVHLKNDCRILGATPWVQASRICRCLGSICLWEPARKLEAAPAPRGRLQPRLLAARKVGVNKLLLKPLPEPLPPRCCVARSSEAAAVMLNTHRQVGESVEPSNCHQYASIIQLRLNQRLRLCRTPRLFFRFRFRPNDDRHGSKALNPKPYTLNYKP
jgi:hypothetical protein